MTSGMKSSDELMKCDTTLPTRHELQARVAELTADVETLRSAFKHNEKQHGITLRQRDAAIRRADELAVSEGRLREALEFYADPDTYYATTLLEDRPCGEIADDYSKDHGREEDYDRPMLGKHARSALDIPPSNATAIIQAMREVYSRADNVVYFDWSDNDHDAVAYMNALTESVRKLRELESITPNQEELK